MILLRLFWCASWALVGFVGMTNGSTILSAFAGMMIIFGMMAGK